MTEDNAQMEQPENKPIFRNLTAEDSDQEITIVESLCVNCGHNVWSYFFFYYILNNKLYYTCIHIVSYQSYFSCSTGNH